MPTASPDHLSTPHSASHVPRVPHGQRHKRWNGRAIIPPRVFDPATFRTTSGNCIKYIACVAHHEGKNGAFPSRATLIRECGFSKATLDRVIREARDLGHVVNTGRRKRVTVRRIVRSYPTHNPASRGNGTALKTRASEGNGTALKTRAGSCPKIYGREEALIRASSLKPPSESSGKGKGRPNGRPLSPPSESTPSRARSSPGNPNPRWEQIAEQFGFDLDLIGKSIEQWIAQWNETFRVNYEPEGRTGESLKIEYVRARAEEGLGKDELLDLIIAARYLNTENEFHAAGNPLFALKNASLLLNSPEGTSEIETVRERARRNSEEGNDPGLDDSEGGHPS